MFWNVEVLRDEGDPDARVGLDNIEHHLCANVLQQVFNVVSNERIIVDCAPALIGKHCHHFFHRGLHHQVCMLGGCNYNPYNKDVQRQHAPKIDVACHAMLNVFSNTAAADTVRCAI